MPRPIYCGVAAGIVVAVLLAHETPLSAQGRRKPEPLPKVATLLLPADLAWTITLPDTPSAAGILAGASVVVPLVSGEVHAVDRSSGDTRWVQPVQTNLSPVAAGPYVVVATATHVEARTLEDGNVVWRHTPEGTPRALAGRADQVIVLAGRAMTALDATTGAVRWRRETEPEASSLTLGPAAVAVVAGTRVTVFSAADGRRLWDRNLPGPPIPPAWSGGDLILASGRTLWSLDGRDGDESWKWVFGGTPVGVAAGTEDAYVTALDNVVRALRRGNGHQRWHADIRTRPQYAPVALDGAVFVAGFSPAITLFDGKTGTPIGSYEAPARLLGPPLVPLPVRPGDVSTLLLLYDGRLLALRSTGLSFRELPPVPFNALPGRSLSRERLPLDAP